VDDDQDVRKGMHMRLVATHYDNFFAADAVTALVEVR
jgi:hypothetical protein